MGKKNYFKLTVVFFKTRIQTAKSSSLTPESASASAALAHSAAFICSINLLFFEERPKPSSER
jgi:hypothetical protein